MEKSQIKKLISRKIDFCDMAKAKHILNKNYIIESGKMESADIKNHLNEGSPVAIHGHIIIGYDPMKKAFIDSNESLLQVQRPIEAMAVKQELPDTRQSFVILGRVEWPEDIQDFNNVIGSLKVGEIFLPKHSAVFNFLNPSAEEKADKVQSVLDGIKINIYERENYVDNCLHEMGHLFWRTCLTYDERMQFEEMFKYLKPSAIYEYSWERSTAEEVFCTIYKYYLKSILLNQSFLTILSHEEPEGYRLLQQIFERIAKQRVIDDIWELSKSDINDYLFPKVDSRTGVAFRKKGALDTIKDIELPESILSDIDSVQDGIKYVNFGKAVLPVKGNKIDFENLKKMEKAKSSAEQPLIYLDMDGTIADFQQGYKNAFDKDCTTEDSFTITQTCLSMPYFFRTLPVLERGKQLYERLIKKYQVIFLTTPMKGMQNCKSDKLQWLKEHICENPTVLFSDSKVDYAQSAFDILIDDFATNLEPFAEAGGTAIDFLKMSNDQIMSKISETINPQEEIREIKEQIKKMKIEVEKNPTDKQIKAQNYRKGKIIVKGMSVTIENIPGSIRWGFDENGLKWCNRLKNYYGYFSKTEGNDGDEIDVFISENNLVGNKLYVINQKNPVSNMFDEIKVIMGAIDIDDAKQIYLQNYSKGWEKNIMNIVPTNTKKFREFLNNGNYKEPFKISII